MAKKLSWVTSEGATILFCCLFCERPHSVRTRVSAGRWGSGFNNSWARDYHREREEREGHLGRRHHEVLGDEVVVREQLVDA